MEYPEDFQAIIYAITCQATELSYVGQTRTHKKTRGKWYTYGISQRLVEHIGAAKRERSTPISQAIRKYGAPVFEIRELERCDINVANEREAFHINKLGTLKPNGYNVQKSSRCKGRTNSLFVDGNIVSAELRGIKQNGKLAKVRLLLAVEGQTERKRLMFGKNPETYEKSIEEARQFCTNLGVDPVEHNSLRGQTVLWWPYKEKIESLDGIDVSYIKVLPFSTNQIVIRVRPTSAKTYKEQVSMVFGSKKIAKEDSLKVALSVAEELSARLSVEYTLDKSLRSATGDRS